MKQQAERRRRDIQISEGISEAMSTEYIWETFDSLFKTVHRQGRRMEELEARIIDLESRLRERAERQAVQPQPVAREHRTEMPAERAA